MNQPEDIAKQMDSIDSVDYPDLGDPASYHYDEDNILGVIKYPSGYTLAHSEETACLYDSKGTILQYWHDESPIINGVNIDSFITESLGNGTAIPSLFNDPGEFRNAVGGGGNVNLAIFTPI